MFTLINVAKKKKEKNRKDASPFLKDTRKGGMDACWEGWMGAFEEYVERSGWIKGGWVQMRLKWMIHPLYIVSLPPFNFISFLLIYYFFNVLFTVPLHPTFVFLCSPATTLASPPFFLHPIIWWMYKDVLSRQREYGGFKRELSVCITECCTPKAELNSVTPHIKRLIYMFI